MRAKKNTRLLLIDLVILCSMVYFLCLYAIQLEKSHDCQIIPLSSVSKDSWYHDNVVSIKKGNGVLFHQYTLAATLQADVADAEGIETIEIYTVDNTDRAGGVVMIRDNSGNILTVLSSCAASDNRNTIYLYEKNNQTMLMTLRINFDAEWMYDYQYEIFRLDADNNPVLDTGSQCIFFIGIPTAEQFPLAWMDELESYLADAVLLLSTEYNTLRTYAASDETLPSWYPILYYESYSF